VGIVIVTAGDEAAASAMFAEDPSLVAGLQTAAIYPFNVFIGPER
jgi:hypothetical protein